jgi:hypothetical protein
MYSLLVTALMLQTLTLLTVVVYVVMWARTVIRIRPVMDALTKIDESIKHERRASEVLQLENQELFMKALDCSKKLRHCYRDRADLTMEIERLKTLLTSPPDDHEVIRG